MLRGCSIIFSAILSIIFLKRKLYSFHWIGILITFIGLGIVGASSLLATDSRVESTTGEMLFGFMMLGIGLLANSTQIVVEELFLKKRNIPPALVVGSEGAWGIMGMAVTLTILYYIPGKDKGSYENAYDSAVMISNNVALLFFVIGQWAALWWYNLLALTVTKSLSAVHRTLLDAFRTTFVWIANLFIFYAIDDRYGEQLTDYSLLQAGGFILLLFGTLVYNRIIELPRVNYPGDVGKITSTDDLGKAPPVPIIPHVTAVPVEVTTDGDKARLLVGVTSS